MAEDEKSSAFSVSQTDINSVLLRGSGVENGKFRIVEQFEKQRSAKENTAFLKLEYGTGGASFTFPDGSDGCYWHDGKGISISKSGWKITEPDVRLTWQDAEKQIRTFVLSGRYLTPEEFTAYGEWNRARRSTSLQAAQAALSGRRPAPEKPAKNDSGQMTFGETPAPEAIETRDAVTLHADDPGAPAWVRETGDVTLTRDGDTVTVTPADDTSSEPSFVELDVTIPDDTLPAITDAREYDALKAGYPGALIAFQVGNYYELFGSDAEQAAKILNTKLFECELQGHGRVPVTGFLANQWVDHSHRIWENGLDVVLSGQDGPDAPHHIAKVLKAADYIPIGAKFEIEGRRFAVDTVNFDTEQVSLRDITFQTGVGFPIFRKESIGFVRQTWDDQERRGEPEATEPEHQPAVPEPEKINFHITDDNLGAGGQKTKYGYNIAAIRTLKQIESESRLATPEEQEILSRYVGWGGIPQAFDPENTSWAKEHTELKGLLSDEEYDAARASSLNAHYTSPTIIRAMYDTLERMGFKTGNILEPAMGVGNFFGLVPESIANSRLYGVELDSITGRIAKQLYQKADITVDGFERTDYPDEFFDLAVGNVPFGGYKLADRRYDKNNFLIHDFFFAKTLDKVRTGGLIAFITSKGTLDKQNPEVRKYIARRADLLGAVRLPNNAFQANAGTEVTTDILFLQKRDRMTNEEPDWLTLGETPDGIPVNRYFEEHPEMVLGTMAYDDRMYGNEKETACLPVEGADLKQQLQDALQNINLPDREALDAGNLLESKENEGNELPERKSIPADAAVRNFSFALVDDQLYFRENSRMNPVDMPETTEERIRGMIELRDCTRKLIDLQLNEYGDEAIRLEQGRLGLLYDRFTQKYGLINSQGNKRAFEQDSSYCLLCSLEVLDEDGRLERKADMFTKRTIKQARAITSVDTASEALAVSIAEKACVDLGYMGALMGGSDKVESIIKDLRGIIFKNPESGKDDLYVGWETADEYLSGNVREKLRFAREAAKNDPRFDINVAALEKVQPKDLEASEIDVRLGATWIDPEYIDQFMYELLQTPYSLQGNDITMRYSQVSGEWNIRNKNYDSMDNVLAHVTYGTKRRNAYFILEDSLNLRDVRIFDTVTDDEGKEHRVLNSKETAIAQQKQEAIRQAFRDWIWKDPNRRETLCQKYNTIFNSTRPREYDGRHIRFIGMNPEINLRTHQLNAVAHVMYGQNTLLAHCVGAGKTFEMTAAAMESKRLGLTQKSLFVVPNHLTEQWGGDFLRLYPGANILVATKKDFEPQNRKKFCARIATGEYDAVIIGHSQFERIPVSKERQQETIHRQISDIAEEIRETKADNGERYTIKQMEKTKKGLEARLEKLNDTSRKDDVVTFEELGIDRLFVDEADSFKNLFLYTKMRNVAGIGSAEAQKSSDMFMKCRYMDELTAGSPGGSGRGVTFATGTPISNSMTELYTMMRYLQYDTLQKQGLGHFDSWAAAFGETVTAIELAPEGTGFRAKTRFARFFNLPELISMWKEAADIQTADMLKLPVPEAEHIDVVTKPSEHQKKMVQDLAERADSVRKRLVEPYEDNMLKITSDGRKLALDQRLHNDLLPDDPDSKINACVGNVLKVWRETAEQRGAQLVFCDLSTPHYDGTFNVYDDIKNKLMAQGVPPEEIAFIHDAKTEVQKAELFAKVRKGQVRVLLGSTSKMGAGTNVQDRLVALHHTDCPWKPRDIEQREGRIIRQGNRNETVKIFRYVTEGTFDAYNWALIENKQKFIGQVMTSKSPVRSCDDIDETALSYAEVKALATGDVRIKEKMDLDIQVAKLKMLKADHTGQHYRLEDNLAKHFPQQIQKTEEQIAGLEADLKRLTECSPVKAEDFSMTVMGTAYAEKKDAGAALIEACKQMTDPDATVDVGKYRGFSMQLWIDKFSETFKVTLKNQFGHGTEMGADPLGNITRINNALEAIPKLLAQEREHLETLHRQVDNAKEEIQKPFPQEAELKEKTARLNALNALLSVDEHGSDQDVPEDSAPSCGTKPSIKKMLRQFEKAVPVGSGNSHETEMAL